MKIRAPIGLAGVSLFAIAVSTATAQTASSPAESSEAKLGLEEVVVTARRREESLQDVPQTVDVVGTDTVQKLNLLKFEDIQAIVPGLTLTTNNNPATGQSASIRGVNFEGRTGTSPTVEFYLNDAPIQTSMLFTSMFDIAQVEVLRGPQGTLRGRASPSGAITVTTHKATLNEFGGYALASGTDRNAYNAQGALNIPIISEVLAVRVAGLYESNEFDSIRSIHNSRDPKSETKAGRVSLTFQPIDSVVANVSYQHLDRDTVNYNPVIGSGSPGQLGGTTIIVGGRPRNPYPQNPTLAANYNGPAIEPRDRLAVQEDPNLADIKMDIINGVVDWRFAGQRLAYVGGYQKQDTDAVFSLDAGNVLVGVDPHQTTSTEFLQRSHELRLSSEERLFNLFDYTVGLFYAKQISGPTRVLGPANYLSGAFGSPSGAASASFLDPRYVLNSLLDRGSVTEEKSAFASITWHITNATELAVGGRYIVNKIDAVTSTNLGSSLYAWPTSQLGLTLPGASQSVGACAGTSVTSTYQGFTDVPGACVSAGLIPRRIPVQDEHRKDKPFVYNVQLSHHFTDELMAYANVGSSWRRGAQVLGLNNSPSPGVPADPVIASLNNVPPEKSRSYELGMKTTFWENRARVNVAVYHQKFKGLIFKSTQPIQYLSNNGTGLTPTFFEFIDSADAVVDGVDLDGAVQITRHWNVGLSASYADGHVDNDTVPCNVPGFTFTPAQRIALCKSDETVSSATKWSTTLQSEYSMPIISSMDAYIRGLYTYYPRNSEQIAFKAEQYGLLNLYLGLRAPNNTWDVTLFAKNVTNANRTLQISSFGTLSQDARLVGTGYYPSSGYQLTNAPPIREFGVQVRYAFGSR